MQILCAAAALQILQCTPMSGTASSRGSPRQAAFLSRGQSPENATGRQTPDCPSSESTRCKDFQDSVALSSLDLCNSVSTANALPTPFCAYCRYLSYPKLCSALEFCNALIAVSLFSPLPVGWAGVWAVCPSWVFAPARRSGRPWVFFIPIFFVLSFVASLALFLSAFGCLWPRWLSLVCVLSFASFVLVLSVSVWSVQYGRVGCSYSWFRWWLLSLGVLFVWHVSLHRYQRPRRIRMKMPVRMVSIYLCIGQSTAR